MGHGQRLAFMKGEVMPTMKAAFAAYDSARYGEMRCTTCHGSKAKEGSFAMPNPELPKLPAPNDGAGWEKLAAAKPNAMKFMHQVEVDMAHMLGEEPFDMKTGKGFGCFECHTH